MVVVISVLEVGEKVESVVERKRDRYAREAARVIVDRVGKGG